MHKQDEQITHFFYEVGHLKRIPRAGWQLLRIPDAESVGDHVSRSVVIAYVLAKLEGADASKAALIAAFHELPETRIGDLHKMAQNYFRDKKQVEVKVLADQLAMLPDSIAAELHSILDGEHDDSPERSVARDADFLEVIIQAKEYLEQGHTGCQNWIDNATKCLKTKSAQRLAKQVAKTRSTEWYEGLKRIKR